MIHAHNVFPKPGPGVDISACDREPIHTPNQIQPTGVLLVARAPGLSVTQASANIDDFLGVTPDKIFGRHLPALLGEGGQQKLQRLLQPGFAGCTESVVFTNNSGPVRLQMAAHAVRDLVCVEVEKAPATPDEGLAIQRAQNMMHALHAARSQAELCEIVVSRLRELTGYDRVMVYRFDRQGHGQIIAEDRTEEWGSYLGLRFPASDIPAQARRVYLAQRVRSVADTEHVPVPVLSDPDSEESSPLDMTLCGLRAVSPTHLEYMRNMGVRASLCISLMPGTGLWGMLVCHHRSPLMITADVRSQCGLIGQLISLLLESVGQQELYVEQLARQRSVQAIVARINEADHAAAALYQSGDALLAMVEADGAVVSLGGRTFMLGQTPPLDASLRAMRELKAIASENLLAVDELQDCIPDWTPQSAVASGALLLPLQPHPGDAIIWFRPEQERVVNWGGDPRKPLVADATTGRLSPRHSFATWKEQVRGQSASWEDADRAAAQELRRPITAAIARQAQADLTKMRYSDPLTGLPNRRMLNERLGAQKATDTLALLYLGLDQFKAVNDSFGNAAGDLLLLQVTRRLIGSVRGDDLVVRVGGDEFVILCAAMTVDDAQALAERIRQKLAEPFTIAARPFRSGASLGIAHSSTTKIADLVQAADAAMSVAKRQGGNQAVISTAPLRAEIRRSLQLEQDLYAALTKGEQLSLHFQPMFRVSDRKLLGFEALVRWDHPQFGEIMPNEFVPLAEKKGLIQKLGHWALRQAIGRARSWQEAHDQAAFFMSVNISPLQLKDATFVDDIMGLLEQVGLAASCLCLEITESMLMQPEAIAMLSAIRRVGVRVALDDFGVGYSSLAQLRRLPADLVKLDRGFLESLDDASDQQAFLESVMRLAHTAGLSVVAEGVESQEQFAALQRLGCDAAQGYFLAPPLSPRLAARHIGTAPR